VACHGRPLKEEEEEEKEEEEEEEHTFTFCDFRLLGLCK
jgi:hypothetical protein